MAITISMEDLAKLKGTAKRKVEHVRHISIPHEPKGTSVTSVSENLKVLRVGDKSFLVKTGKGIFGKTEELIPMEKAEEATKPAEEKYLELAEKTAKSVGAKIQALIKTKSKQKLKKVI